MSSHQRTQIFFLWRKPLSLSREWSLVSVEAGGQNTQAAPSSVAPDSVEASGANLGLSILTPFCHYQGRRKTTLMKGWGRQCGRLGQCSLAPSASEEPCPSCTLPSGNKGQVLRRSNRSPVGLNSPPSHTEHFSFLPWPLALNIRLFKLDMSLELIKILRSGKVFMITNRFSNYCLSQLRQKPHKRGLLIIYSGTAVK